MVSFANAKGGFIVFGVSDRPREIVGLQTDRFDEFDPANLTTRLNSHFSPELEWELDDIEIESVVLGFIYVEEAKDKPVVCTSNWGKDLKESEIYYRYRGQSTTIRYPELRAILEERADRERRAWMQHIQKISEVGPTKVGIIDTVKGQIFGAGTPYLIDKSLIDQLKFIREGNFSEGEGKPTLRLIGDVETVDTVETGRTVPVSIDFRDLVNAFLENQQLTLPDVGVYLLEAFRQSSHYIPLHFFIQKAGMTRKDVLQKLENVSVAKSHKEKLRSRISGESRISKVGVVEEPLPDFETVLDEGLLVCYRAASTQKEKRSIVLTCLLNKPELVLEHTESIEHSRILEAITHLPAEQVIEHWKVLRKILQTMFSEKFDNWSGVDKTQFRKTLSYLDDCLFLEN